MFGSNQCFGAQDIALYGWPGGLHPLVRIEAEHDAEPDYKEGIGGHWRPRQAMAGGL